MFLAFLLGGAALLGLGLVTFLVFTDGDDLDDLPERDQ